MNKHRVYMVQPNYLHASSTYLPYASGTLVASALADDYVSQRFDFGEIFFLRESPDSVLDRMESPFLVGFSNYIWNYEYNRVLAQKLKQRFPECIVVFGGHHISPASSCIDECGFADYFIFGEGEEVFVLLLKALTGNGRIEDVPNIAYFSHGETVFTQTRRMDGCDYPSPYLTGCFDSILEKHSELEFYAVIETSRGCPYKCAYCDWGNLNSKLKNFPLERIYAELEWLCEKGIDGFGGADANFGIIKRDELIIDRMVELHNKTGHLKNFQTSWAKNSNETVFNMTKMLNACGMNKGVTLSFQTLCPLAAKNVGRENITVDSYRELLERYNGEGIATYTELILGLPGETYSSFVDGIESLLEAGQHRAIYVHNCESLPCARLADEDYVRRFSLEISRIPLNQPHRSAECDGITEYSSIITSTCSLSQDDWVRSNVFSCAVGCFHSSGLLELFAVLLYHEAGVKYVDFYSGLLEFIKSSGGVCSRVFADIETRLRRVPDGGELTAYSPEFGDVLWPFEEYVFLRLITAFDEFYAETEPYLKRYIPDTSLFEELLAYQKNVIKRPSGGGFDFKTEYNFREYFAAALSGGHIQLKKETELLHIPVCESGDLTEYARNVVWYGRKNSGCLHTPQKQKDGEID